MAGAPANVFRTVEAAASVSKGAYTTQLCRTNVDRRLLLNRGFWGRMIRLVILDTEAWVENSCREVEVP